MSLRIRNTAAKVAWADAILRELDIRPEAAHTAAYHLRERSGGFLSGTQAADLVMDVAARRAEDKLRESQAAPMTRREILDELRDIVTHADYRSSRTQLRVRLRDLLRRATTVQDGEPVPDSKTPLTDGALAEMNRNAIVPPPPGYVLETWPRANPDGTITVRLRKVDGAPAPDTSKPPASLVLLPLPLAEDIAAWLDRRKVYPRDRWDRLHARLQSHIRHNKVGDFRVHVTRELADDVAAALQPAAETTPAKPGTSKAYELLTRLSNYA
jgi:hypothetical protein